MKVWVVLASNDEYYEDNMQDIWAICGSEESAKWCITDANVRAQISRDNKRYDELQSIIGEDKNCCTDEIQREMDKIYIRKLLLPRNRKALPSFSIREYDIMD